MRSYEALKNIRFLRSTLYDTCNTGENNSELSRQMGIKRTTAWSIIKRADENDGQISRPGGGARQACMKVTEDMRQIAVTIVEEHPEHTLEKINGQPRRHHRECPPTAAQY